MSDYSFDCMYTIGDSHSVCEDYAWAGMIQNKYPCAIISDGCSSSDDTDIGSRIIVRSIIEILEVLTLDDNSPNVNYHLINHLLGDKINLIRTYMGLSIQALDATIRVVFIVDDLLYLYNYGDGFTVIRNHTTDNVITEYTRYSYNAPYYFNYETHDKLKSVYLETFGNKTVDYSGETLDVKDYVEGNHYTCFKLSDLGPGVITISVMSDGVETFFQGNDNLITSEVLNDITLFKNFRGNFVQRKLGKFLSRHAKNNIKHYDDISVATIKFEIDEDSIQQEIVHE